MIPTFPKFKRLELSDRPKVEQFTSRYPPYSDFNFTSLWCWDVYGQVLLSQLDDHLIVRFTDDTTGKPFYSFLGSNKELSWKLAETLLMRAEAEGLDSKLRLIPEDVATAMNHGRFQIEEDRDNHDYIISLGKLLTFRGTPLQNHRRLMNCFKRQYPNARIVNLEVDDKFTQRLIERLSATWTENKGYSVLHEKKALKRLFQIEDMADISCHGLYIKNDLVAFHVTETLCNCYAIDHFMKADTRLKGVYSYFLQKMAKILSERGFCFLNIEQDLGIPGLRMAKACLRPVHFLKKYKIYKT
jgi:hypothetical protein